MSREHTPTDSGENPSLPSVGTRGSAALTADDLIRIGRALILLNPVYAGCVIALNSLGVTVMMDGRVIDFQPFSKLRTIS